MSDKWEKFGNNTRFSDILPGGHEHDYVRNTETGEAKEVYHSGDIGEAIENGQFTDRDVSNLNK
ncbi:MAG: hypothetical protein Q3M24_08725 [Candidatus Electrothrix aestuarii]|uniref:Uncharacterized protein n=1 Tax=Candidatus Electrothrix aestuarii TaxID=3062594 RepID=A0AAU8M191_9BACT|nr:hypothetical protein [Candidatus Electrothrix aestuarii]